MTEPTQATPDVAKTPADSIADGRAGERAAAEPRSFQAADQAARAAVAAGQNAAGKAGAAATEAGRTLAEAARQAPGQAAEVWRSSLDSFAAMQAEMRQMFDDAWRRATGLGLGVRAPMMTAHPFAAGAPAFLGQPATDVRETPEAYHLAVELPGLAREDIDLSVRDDLITVCGHKVEEGERTAGAYRVSERRFGRFERSFPAPPDVDRDRIEASFRDGVLRVTLPRRADAAPPSTRIEVKG